MPFAPSWPACWSIRSSASWRVRSHRLVRSVMLRPTRSLKAGADGAKMERDLFLCCVPCPESAPLHGGATQKGGCFPPRLWQKLSPPGLCHQDVNLLEHGFDAPPSSSCLLAQGDHLAASPLGSSRCSSVSRRTARHRAPPLPCPRGPTSAIRFFWGSFQRRKCRRWPLFPSQVPIRGKFQ